MNGSSPSGLYSALVGAVLVVTGIIGFFYEASFETGVPGVEADEVFGILAVNGWHNLIHIAAGLLGLFAAGAGGNAARTYALGFGLIYLVLAIWGFADSDNIILSAVPLNDEDNVLHLALGLLGLGAGAATPKRAATAAA